ncbi:MAG: TetR/AcrR family transcriptional regulator [Acidimicrobiales bacterium]
MGPMAEIDEAVGDQPVDGRRARRHRSRDLAVDALLDLLNEGIARPTAQQVAERSGVSLRSIFRIFDDVQSLHMAASDRQMSRVRHLFVDIVASGTLEERVRATVATTTRLYEQVAPIRRAALRAAPESATLQLQLSRARGWLRAEIDRVFAEELERAGDPDLTAAVEAILSFETWDQLRVAQGRSVARSAASVSRAVETLLR